MTRPPQQPHGRRYPPPPPQITYAQPPQWTQAPLPRKGPGTGLIFGGLVGVLAVVAVIVTLVIALAGRPVETPVISGPSGEPAANDAVLKVAQIWPMSLMPGNAGDESVNSVTTALYAGLTRIDPATGMPVYRLAESVTTGDAKTWTITIRPGFTFHNGEAVTAKSFVDAWNFAADETHDQIAGYSFERIAGYTEARSGAGMSGLKVLDERTFTVTLTEPWASFPTALSMPAWSPLAAACLADTGTCADRPIGNGPFKYERGTKDTVLTLSRWDGFNGEKPQFGGLEFRFFDEREAAADVLRSGQVDFGRFTVGVTGATMTRPTGQFLYIGFPTDKDPYRSPDLRRAISLAIDREAITELLPGLTPATTFTPPGLPGHNDASCADCRHDPAAAKTAFAASKWDVKTPIRLQASQSNTTAMKYLTMACQNVTAALGVDCQVMPVDRVQFNQDMAGHKLTTGWASGWVPDYGSSEAYLRPLYGEGNYFGYTDPAFNQAVATANASVGLEAAAPLYAAAETSLNAGMPLVPIAYEQYMAGTGPNVLADSVVVDPVTETPQWDLIKVAKG